MFSFRVDDVEAAKEALPTQPLRATLGPVLAFGGAPDTPVIDTRGVHPLFAAVHAAFAEHRPLALSPDAIWLTIAQGVAQHVRLNAARLRERLVRSKERKALELSWDGELPRDEAGASRLLHAIRERLEEEIGAGPARLLACDFTTSGPVERTASEIVLLDAYSPYFDYVVSCICGIPELTLLGEPDDWRSLRRRLDVVAELDLSWWTRSLVPIADRLVAASEGHPDVEFFQRLYKPKRSYGWDRATGWIARLFPYLKRQGRIATRNPLLEEDIDWQPPEGEADEDQWYSGPGVTSEDVPAGLASCLVRVQDQTTGRRFDVDAAGGLMAVEQDAQGRLVPRAGWVMRESTASIDAVMEEIRNAHRFVPSNASADGGAFEGPAELVAFYSAFDEVTLSTARGPWRIRPTREHEQIWVGPPLHRAIPVTRFADLPDGGFLVLACVEAGARIARMQQALLAAPKEGPVGEPIRESSEDTKEIPLLKGGLADLLSRALAAEGEIQLEATGNLYDALPEWQKRPAPPRPPRRRKWSTRQ